MTIELGFRRADGTAVGVVNGHPYHFTKASPHWADIADDIAALPLQEALPDGRMLPEYVDGVLVTDAAGLPVFEVPSAPVSVSARQFKLQLLASGMFEAVEAWVAAQPLPVRIAYDNSATFQRDDATLQSGFAAMGATPEQVDAFFAAAALI